MSDGELTEPSQPASPAGAPAAAPAPLFEMLDLDSVADEAEPDFSLDRSGYTVTITVADDAQVDVGVLCEAVLAVLIEEAAPKGQLDLHLVDVETV